ncbi:hypothetical protein BU17DRAFT_78031 [Hysterangium stoloniferum]|nr:hypothetical protein BU17DRAFT_78031 [Hysterangium stoloniferum]
MGQDSDDWIMLDEVLYGSHCLEVSHAGGELSALTDLKDKLTISSHVCRVDYRTRQDRTERCTAAFEGWMEALTDAYMDWCLKYVDQDDPVPDLPLTADSSVYLIHVVDLFNSFIISALVRQGLMPSAPLSPSVCITIKALELYRVTHLRSPRLSIQAWVKTLCDMHGVQFHCYLSRQFSITFDLYLSICHATDKIVQTSLNRDLPDWRLRHASPACTYKLKDEKPLLFSLLFTMDGNDSLKRIRRRVMDEDGMPGSSSEHTDSRKVHDDFYLTREEVDKWAHKPLQNLMAFNADRHDVDYNPCADRWKNMKDDITKRMWAIFDETGVFLALSDMVQSGELVKYPSAVVAKLLQVFGKDLGGRFDIGCQFKTTLAQSPLGPQAKELNYTSLIGGFHGHVHRRLCQFVHLATYTKGLGLEDLEGCEQAFSNQMIAFHRMQAITTYFKYNDDMEVYQNLTTFLYNNYKQALDIINSGPTALSQAMQDLQISNFNVFEEWREEEKIYLEGLSKEPIMETLEMEYYQKLINLRVSEKNLDNVRAAWIQATPITISTSMRDNTISLETTWRHLLEGYEKDLKIVQDLEKKLVVAKCWEPGSAEWVNTSKLVAMRMYQQALDQLEGLIVAQMFELTKLNMLQTGYKLRKHIAKALQSHSQAIQTALGRYNTAAKGLPIPRRQLEWKEVVEYAFLADFDLLHDFSALNSDARQDISHKLWATPAGRLAMDLYFKIQCAYEEINQLNIEVRRVATYIYDEMHYLYNAEKNTRLSDLRIAHQIWLHSMCRLHDIASLAGFSGSIVPGTSIQDGEGESARVWKLTEPAGEGNGTGDGDASTGNEEQFNNTLTEQEEAEEEEAEEEAEYELIQNIMSLLTVSED